MIKDKISLFIIGCLFSMISTVYSKSQIIENHKVNLLNILVVFQPDVIPSGNYTKETNHPIVEFTSMESLAPLRFNFAMNLNTTEASHALDGQDLFSWQSTNLFKKLTLEAIDTTKSKVIVFVGRKKVPKYLIDALKLASKNGKKVLIISSKNEIFKQFNIKLPNDSKKEKGLPVIYDSQLNSFDTSTIKTPKDSNLFFANIANCSYMRNNLEEYDAFAWYNLFSVMSDETQRILSLIQTPKVIELAKIRIITKPFFTKPGENVSIKFIIPEKYKNLDISLNISIYDMTGRLLEKQNKKSNDFNLVWRIPKLGTNSQYFRLKTALFYQKKEVAKSESSIYTARQAKPREKIYYGIWQNNSVANSEYVSRLVTRLFKHSGVDTLTSRDSAFSEKYGFRTCIEAGNGAVDKHFAWSFKSFKQLLNFYMPTFQFTKSSAYNFISWGEEPGFISYITGKFPKHAHRWFRRFLKTRYKNINELNTVWQTNFKSWKEVYIKKENLGKKVNLPLTSSDKIIDIRREIGIDKNSILPYIGKNIDTQTFFYWYFDNLVKTFSEESMKKYPFAEHFMSSPNSLHAETPIASLSNHPFYAKEIAFDITLKNIFAGYNNPFGRLSWYFIDDPYLQANILNRQLANMTVFYNAWYAMPHQFNLDLTQTQASARMSKTLKNLRKKAEGPYTQRFYDTQSQVGIFYFPYLTKFVFPRSFYGNGGIKGLNPRIWEFLPCISQTGISPIYIDNTKLMNVKVAVLKDKIVPKSTIIALKNFVSKGGTLIIFPGAGMWDENGIPYGNYTSSDLAKLSGISPVLGIKKHQEIKWSKESGLNQFFKNEISLPKGYKMRAFYENVDIVSETTKILGKYPDNTPALTLNKIGKGNVFYLNIGQTRKPNSGSWDSGNHLERYALSLLFEYIFKKAGVKNDLPRLVKLKSDIGPHQILWNRTYNSTKDITYISAHLDGRAKSMTAQIILPKKMKLKNMLSEESMPSNSQFLLAIKRGEFKFVALRKSDPSNLLLSLDKIIDMLKITVKLESLNRGIWSGQRPIRISFIKPNGKEAEKQGRWISLIKEKTIEYQIALDDLSGKWTVEAWEPVSGLKSKKYFNVNSKITKEKEISAQLYKNTPEETVKLLKGLTHVYLTANTRSELSYYLQAKAFKSRHSIIRHLERVNWLKAKEMIVNTIKKGETLILTGEDLGFYPNTPFRTNALFENNSLIVLQKLIDLAEIVYTPKKYPTTLIGIIGKGKLILNKISLDETYPPSQAQNLGFPKKTSQIGLEIKKWREFILSKDQNISLEKKNNIILQKWLTTKEKKL